MIPAPCATQVPTTSGQLVKSQSGMVSAAYHLSFFFVICVFRQAAVSKQSFEEGEVHYFEVEVCDPKRQSSNPWSFVIGVCPPLFQARHQQQWIGSQGSW